MAKQTQPKPWAMLGAGVELGGVVALMALLGWWLDRRWGTTPWLLLTGLTIATIGGIYNLYRLGKRSFHE